MGHYSKEYSVKMVVSIPALEGTDFPGEAVAERIENAVNNDQFVRCLNIEALNEVDSGAAFQTLWPDEDEPTPVPSLTFEGYELFDLVTKAQAYVDGYPGGLGIDTEEERALRNAVFTGHLFELIRQGV